MALHQIKVSVSDLAIGMYVANLDRPWVETPFPLQGFYIVSHKDILDLKPYCEYVYVDVERGEAPKAFDIPAAPAARSVTRTTRPSTPAVSPKVARLKKKHGVYTRTAPLKKELNKAVRVYGKISTAVDRFMTGLYAGKPLELAEARRIVQGMVGSIIRNPDALVWLSKIKGQDEYTYSHSVRSSIWAVVFGRHLGLSEQGLETLALGVLLADAGKTKLPAELVTKSGPLSPEESGLMERHVEYGVEILRNTKGISDLVVSIVAAHHERHNGSGYPRGLKGDQIPYLAKIAGIVDCYEGMINPRQSATAVTSSDAMAKLYDLRNIDFQEELVDEFIQAIGIYPAGTLVELSTKEIGIIVAQNYSRRLRPQLMLVLDEQKQALKKFRLVDLLKQEKTPSGRPIEIARSLEAGAYNIDPKKIHATSFAPRWGSLFS